MEKVLVNLVVALMPFFIGYVGLKYGTRKLIKSFIPDGVAFANKLNGDNVAKLKRAVSEVELLVLEKVPAVYRPLVDYMIDTDYIVQLIERYITEEKRKKLD